MVYVFGPFELDTDHQELRRQGAKCAVEPATVNLLAYLLECRDRVVSKMELQDQIEPGETVSESVVTRAVRLARGLVDDDGVRQHTIRTVRGRGYQIIADVQLQPAGPLPETRPETRTKPPDASEVIVRRLSFTPQYYQAGLGLLAYVGTILRQCCPDISVIVRIEQDDLAVRLCLESSPQHRDQMEQVLITYGGVIADQLPPEELLSNPLDAQALRQKFNLVTEELRLTRSHILQAQRDGHYLQERVTSLGTDITELRQQVGAALQAGATA